VRTGAKPPLVRQARGLVSIFPWLLWSWFFFPCSAGFVGAGSFFSPLETVFFDQSPAGWLLGWWFLLAKRVFLRPVFADFAQLADFARKSWSRNYRKD